MTPSRDCYELIKSFEGLSLAAYKDPGSANGLPITIGYGTTMYDDGRKPKLGDVITKDRAQFLLEWEVNNKAKSVAAFLSKTNIKQCQFDGCVSFAYNCGVGAFQRSTLLKKIKANPNDPSIRAEFLKWNKAGGKTMKGLIRRRTAEADLYFKN